ncbi:MAG: bifunctional pyr operon transcriptional regulator/uracil phosphoribosyltransferase PyrR [Halorhodospira halophila]|uniref:bifunctional pyr operon transcriptional regulator/uracil phosphoribosyltransferase PyrR n=1 Tax=Halorhodospira TaxID=85108 RepID=UPI001913511B|nr:MULTISPECIES: bifunctional pyr operon transcriptional regulator/uracil phosphoribosyltransferase PyrR [Halorhodospira]MBK5935915.1 bifunctional pyr operon transcriptional regulator/uracil phosphoribosyltransferase [Halorhodospira halophila]MBK5943261.1 bifunctional pyr operon transcriptional regulator/uracil phosphoribosyltransferase [Halorhodospira halophila]MCC3751477.1 bifunctional pyr operon transcriptional regulator/uracil phosphoribosyltransferase PyrR [Halorhodospira halophila]MCG5526
MTDAEIDVPQLLDTVAAEINTELERRGIRSPILVGIHTGGVWVARGLHDRLLARPPVGTLEVAFHRDDYATSGLKAAVQTSEVPVTLDGRAVLLVDDVIHTGRTTRAALNALFDYGRPQQVLLAVLVDRGGRELPVQPDVTGTRLELPGGQRLKLRGPEPLRFMLEGETP